MELEPTSTVSDRLRFHTERRVMGWGIGALFFTPLIIPAVVDGLGSSNANKRITRDVEHKAIGSDSLITINPGQKINKVIFVHRNNCKGSFSLTMKNKGYWRDSVTFDLEI